MQKVWEELKNIEAQAEQIQIDAKEKAKQLIVQAEKDAQTLLANSQTYGAEESKKQYDAAVKEANGLRQKKLEETEKVAHNLKKEAEKRMDKTVSTVINAVLEEKI